MRKLCGNRVEVPYRDQPLALRRAEQIQRIKAAGYQGLGESPPDLGFKAPEEVLDGGLLLEAIKGRFLELLQEPLRSSHSKANEGVLRDGAEQGLRAALGLLLGFILPLGADPWHTWGQRWGSNAKRKQGKRQREEEGLVPDPA